MTANNFFLAVSSQTSNPISRLRSLASLCASWRLDELLPSSTDGCGLGSRITLPTANTVTGSYAYIRYLTDLEACTGSEGVIE